ncbi:hypothetical protein Tco_1499831 [Tanacetum coccineum]
MLLVTPDLKEKVDETEEINIEEKEASNVKSGDTEELDLETVQSTARQSTITPRTLNFSDEAEEPKKKKLTLQQIRALETTNDEEVARKIQAEWDAEEERKRFEELKKAKPKTTLRKPTSLAQERNQMMNFLKGQGYKNLQKLKNTKREKQMLKERDEKRLLRKRKATISEEQPSKKLKLRTETIDELRNYLRIVDFEKNAQDRESLRRISIIYELQVIDFHLMESISHSQSESSFQGSLNTLWEILHNLDDSPGFVSHISCSSRYYEHIPLPPVLGMNTSSLLGYEKRITSIKRDDDKECWIMDGSLKDEK